MKIITPAITNLNPTTETNSNFDLVEQEFQNRVLYRDNPDGEPNQMENSLDMNSNRILNLPAPSNVNEAARLKDVQNALAGGDASLIKYTASGTGSVESTVQNKLREFVSVKDFGAVGDGVTDDTTAIRNAVDSGAAILYFPEGSYKITSAIVLTGDLTLFGFGGATIIPSLGTAGGNVFQSTSGTLKLRGLAFDGGASQPTNAVANTYIVYTGNASPYMESVTIEDCTFYRCSVVGSTDVETNLIVTHCIYLQGVDKVTIVNNSFDTVSGAAIFLKHIGNLRQSVNKYKDVQWYNVNLDYNVCGSITSDEFDCSLPSGVYWGGAINTVNNQGETPNHDIIISKCTFDGYFSYGAVIRLQSDNGVTVADNTFLDCDTGTLAGAGATLSLVGVTTRNPDGVTPSAPPSSVKIVSNRALNGVGGGTGFRAFAYINNDGGTGGRAPIKGLIISNNTVRSPSASRYFTHLAIIHGRSTGVEDITVQDNYGQLYLKTNSPLGGGIGFIGTDANGLVQYIDLGGNFIENLETPVDSTQVGIQVGANVNFVRSAKPNLVKGCFYGVRTISGTGPVLELLDDQQFSGNTTDTLFSQVLSRYGKDLYATIAAPASVVSGSTTTQNITVTGAAFGDAVSFGTSADITGFFISSVKVRVADSVTLLYTNTTGSTINASAVTVNVTVHKRNST